MIGLYTWCACKPQGVHREVERILKMVDFLLLGITLFLSGTEKIFARIDIVENHVWLLYAVVSQVQI